MSLKQQRVLMLILITLLIAPPQTGGAAFASNLLKQMQRQRREWSSCNVDYNIRHDCKTKKYGSSFCEKPTMSVSEVNGRFRSTCSNVPAGGGALFMTRHHDQTSNSLPRVQQSSSYSNYYLLSTFTVWRKILVTTSLLFLVRFIVASLISSKSSSVLAVSTTTATMGEGGVCHAHTGAGILSNISNNYGMGGQNNHGLVGAVVSKVRDVALPLLSSACCAIQLFLNTFAAGVGCAGFNKALGPLRPYFISLLLYTTITTFSKEKVVHFVFSWLVAFMPEFVHIVNSKNDGHRKAPRMTAMTESSAVVLPKQIVVELDVQDMGCVACINKINGSMRTFNSNVIEAKSWLNEDGVKGGKTRVVYQVEQEATDEMVQQATEEICKVVKDAGFQCEIASVQSM